MILLERDNKDEYLKLMFDAFDEDKSGYLDFKELSLILAIETDTRDSEIINFSFKIFDTDRDGKISANELQRVIRVSFPLVKILKNKKKLKVLLIKIMADTHYYEQKEEEGIKGLKALADSAIAEFDKDGDGYLNEAEFLDFYNDLTD